MRVADYIAKFIADKKTDAVFLLSGGGMMHLLDAVGKNDQLKYICNHHEQASGIAADAYARISGKVGVCYATSGPGGTNTLTAVVGANQDSSPVLFISGQSKVSQTIEGRKLHGLRQFGTFEVDIIPLVKDSTKYSAFVESKELIRYHLEKAFFLAQDGRPGAVFLDIPIDIQGAQIEPEALKGFDPMELNLKNRYQTVDYNEIIKLILSAKRPLILAGYGVRASGGTEAFQKLVNNLNVPVVTTCFGKDIISYDNKLFVGHPGVKGDRPGNFAIQTADLIICLGASLHVTTTGYELDQFAPKAKIIFIDPDEFVHKRLEVNIFKKIKTDVSLFIKQLDQEVIKSGATPLVKNSEWQTRCLLWKNEFGVIAEKINKDPSRLDFYDFIFSLDQLASPSDIIATDAGSAFYVVGQAFRVKSGQRIINSGSLGAMGFAVPAATGCALAAPDRRVLCVTGDGSLMTNLHELSVIKHNKLNVKIFIINNNGYVCIRNTQNNFFKGHLVGTSSESGVFIPSLKKLADAFDLKYIKIDKKDDLQKGIQTVLNTEGPIFCEIVTPPVQEIIPTVSSIKLEDGSMKSKPLHDMFPFMDSEKLNKIISFKD